MALGFFTFTQVFPPVVDSAFQFFIAFVMDFITLLDIYYVGLLDHIIGLFVVSFSPRFALLDHVVINKHSSCSLVATFLFFGKESAAYS